MGLLGFLLGIYDQKTNRLIAISGLFERVVEEISLWIDKCDARWLSSFSTSVP